MNYTEISVSVLWMHKYRQYSSKLNNKLYSLKRPPQNYSCLSTSLSHYMNNQKPKD